MPGDAREAQLGDQAVLEGLPGALDAPLRLRRVGQDELNAQFLKRPGELGRVAPAAALLLQALGVLGSALEDTMPVAVEGQRDAVPVDDLLEHDQVAVGVLLLPEQGEGDRPGGVVHGADERQVGAAALQPVVPAPVDLQQHPLLGVALPSTVALGRPAAARTADAPGQQDPPDGGAGQADALPLRQHLGEMRVVEARIGASGQRQHLLLHLRGRGGRRLPASVPVSHGRSALPSVRRQEPPRMALAHPHQPGRLSHRRLPLDHAVQHLEPRLFSPRQRQSFHRLTFSLNSYLLTESLHTDTDRATG